MKKWYVKDFAKVFGNIEKEVVSFLNELNHNGVTPENIKISSPTASYTAVYYFNDKEVK